MRQSTNTIGASQKNIFAIAGDNFVNVNIKITKATVSASLKDGILEAGTLITKAGAVATSTTSASDAYGVLVNDIDFNNSNGTEIGAVCIHGFIKESATKFNATAGIKAKEIETLNQIKFL